MRENFYNYSMSNKKEILTFLRSPKIKQIFADNHIPKAYLVGSFAHGNSTDMSDIDIMYVRPKDTPFTLMNIGNIKSRLEEASGRSVDLVSENGIRDNLKLSIEKDKTLIFG